MKEKEYDQEYYTKELEIKRKALVYLTGGIGVVGVIEVTSHCLVINNLYKYNLEIGDNIPLEIILILWLLLLGFMWNAFCT